MSRKTFDKRNVRKLTKVGGGKTYSLTLPIDMVRRLGWREKQKLVVDFDEGGKKLIVRDWKK